MYDAIIIGGGISGLTAARALKARGADITLLESKPFVGGNVRTIYEGGFAMEAGPNSFMGSADSMWRLVSDLGMESEVEKAGSASDSRYIFRDGRLMEMPMSLSSFIFSPLLSLRAKLRLMLEPLIPNGAKDDESAHSFFVRRFGEEAATFLMGPFVSGVYAGDPHQLGARAAFRKFWTWERESGSMIIGAIKYMRAKRRRLAALGLEPKSGLYSFKGGLGRIAQKLASELEGRISLNAETISASRINGGYSVKTKDAEYRATSLIIAAPPKAASSLLAGIAPNARAPLDAIPMSPVALVHWTREREGEELPDGFGFLVPRMYKLRTLGTIFSSRLFSGRAPDGERLFSSFYGGTLDPSFGAMSDLQIADALSAEHRIIFRRPDLKLKPLKIMRYESAIPQLTPDHPERMELVDAELKNSPGLYLAGNYLAGVGIDQAAQSGYDAAEKASAFLSGGRVENAEGEIKDGIA